MQGQMIMGAGVWWVFLHDVTYSDIRAGQGGNLLGRSTSVWLDKRYFESGKSNRLWETKVLSTNPTKLKLFL